MALTNERTKYFHQSWGPIRTVRNQVIKAGVKLFHGGLSMAVGGVGNKLLSGASLAALATTIAGADANGGLVVRARQPSVRVQLLGGVSKSLGVNVVFGATIDVVIQQATDGGGVTTNTALEAANAVRAHALANSLVAIKHTGTGAGLTATAAAGAVAHIAFLGAAAQTYDASAALADKTLDLPDGIFEQGTYLCLGASGDEPSMPGALVGLADCTCKKTLDPLDFVAPMVGFEGSAFYVDISQAR